jgi:hypothetical protein
MVDSVLSRVVEALFALNGRYLINEKGAVPEAVTFPLTLPGLAEAQALLWKDIGDGEHARALSRLREVSGGLKQLLQRTAARS